MNGAGPSSARQGVEAAAVGPVALDEVMLAMDVVDTLRHREQWVAQELADGDRDAALLERLRRTYAAQGIDVPERVLLDGVAALREDRFAYRPPPPSLARAWATLYVRRTRWARRLAVVAVLAVLGFVAYQQTVVAPRAALVAGLTDAHAAIVALAREPEARQRAADLVAAGRAALTADDAAAAGRARASLEELRDRLAVAYELRIVAGDGVTSGVWRVPDDNPRARNYYLIVEAVDASGRVLTLPVLDEETGRVRSVTSWGLRVDEATWQRVAADKSADGIIQQRVVGRKVAGDLEPSYGVASTGGAITRW